MKIVFVSNYYNHHQSALSEALYALTNGQYVFVQTEEMEQERKSMGWGGAQLPPFVICGYESDAAYKLCRKLIEEADVVIAGGSPTVEKYIQKRIKAGKLLFRYSERVYKNAHARKQMLLRGLKYHLCNFPYKNVYLLSASAYAAADYAKTGNFVGKAYRWGYFPQVEEYGDIDSLLAKKESGTILWVARMIDWKRPEVCLQIAKRLKADGYRFRINMIGNGALEQSLRRQIAAEGLEDCVYMLGAMTPEQVREHMERAAVFLFTSGFDEGWGAVLNEAMNSGCAVAASHAIGATPYLLQDGENGLVYKDGDMEDLYGKIKTLLDDSEKRVRLGKCAYETLTQTWNAQEAAARLMKLAEKLLAGEKYPDLYEDGPCSKDQCLENDWYKQEKL